MTNQTLGHNFGLTVDSTGYIQRSMPTYADVSSDSTHRQSSSNDIRDNLTLIKIKMEEHYTKIVENIFGNWTALQLAVEHSMGGPNSKQTALELVNYIAQYCISEQQNIEAEDIADVLEDIMDQEFDTICEDNSINEVSNLLYRFLQLLKEGNTAQCEIEYNNLPTGKLWLSQSQHEQNVEINETHDVEANIAQEQMEQDLGWTEVKTRRKR